MDLIILFNCLLFFIGNSYHNRKIQTPGRNILRLVEADRFRRVPKQSCLKHQIPAQGLSPEIVCLVVHALIDCRQASRVPDKHLFRGHKKSSDRSKDTSPSLCIKEQPSASSMKVRHLKAAFTTNSLKMFY